MAALPTARPHVGPVTAQCRDRPSPSRNRADAAVARRAKERQEAPGVLQLVWSDAAGLPCVAFA
jgi:hypothetical protein